MSIIQLGPLPGEDSFDWCRFDTETGIYSDFYKVDGKEYSPVPIPPEYENRNKLAEVKV